MKKISIVGLDLAKRIFQVHGIDEHHQVVVQKALQRSELRRGLVNLNPASSAWKLAQRRIIGRVRLASWDMMSNSSRRLT